MRTNRRYAAIGLTAGLLGGGAAGLLLGVPGIGAAASGGLVAQDDTTTDDTTDDTTESTEWREMARDRVRERIQPLVDDGTITADQADAVADELVAEGDGWWGGGGPGGPRGGSGMGHHHEGRGGHPGFDGEVVADLLGVTPEELRDALMDGSTIAELAEANGVDVQTVIDALVAEAEGHLDLAVEDGRLTEEEATERLDDITERITEHVEEGFPARG